MVLFYYGPPSKPIGLKRCQYATRALVFLRKFRINCNVFLYFYTRKYRLYWSSLNIQGDLDSILEEVFYTRAQLNIIKVASFEQIFPRRRRRTVMY